MKTVVESHFRIWLFLFPYRFVLIVLCGPSSSYCRNTFLKRRDLLRTFGVIWRGNGVWKLLSSLWTLAWFWMYLFGESRKLILLDV